jgi:hypothetical protein
LRELLEERLERDGIGIRSSDRLLGFCADCRWVGREEEGYELGEGHGGRDEKLAEEFNVLEGEAVGEKEGEEGRGRGAEEEREFGGEGEEEG